MNVTIYEEATWYDIERNKKHMKKDGEHYVADAMLLRENANLRQENESLKKENDRLRELIDEVHEMLCADRVGMFRRLILAELEDGMHELGIEV